MVFTADHGRGRTSSDWGHHGKDVPGSEETFILVLGPEAGARGELRNTANVEGQVAALTASALGLQYDRSGCARRSEGMVGRVMMRLANAGTALRACYPGTRGGAIR